MIRHFSQSLDSQIGLVSQGPFASLCNDQMGLDVQCTCRLQQPNAETAFGVGKAREREFSFRVNNRKNPEMFADRTVTCAQ